MNDQQPSEITDSEDESFKVENFQEGCPLFLLPYECYHVILSYHECSTDIFSLLSCCKYFYHFFKDNPNNYSTCENAIFYLKEISEPSSTYNLSNVSFVQNLYILDNNILEPVLIGYVKLFINLKMLSIKYCSNITDTLFGYLGSLEALEMNQCNNEGKITYRSFKNLKNIRKLDMTACYKIDIEKAFKYISDVEILNLNSCYQLNDSAFRCFKNLSILDISLCRKITDKAFVYFKGIKALTMENCNQYSITNDAFKNLEGIHTLDISECSQPTITDTAFIYLIGIYNLDISYCNQLSDKAFRYIQGVKILNMRYCNQSIITDEAFTFLKGIKELNMSKCDQKEITYDCFSYIKGISILNISGTKKDSEKVKNILGDDVHLYNDIVFDYHTSNSYTNDPFDYNDTSEMIDQTIQRRDFNLQ